MEAMIDEHNVTTLSYVKQAMATILLFFLNIKNKVTFTSRLVMLLKYVIENRGYEAKMVILQVIATIITKRSASPDCTC